ncbi:hypothetical protein BD770DRAFT_407362 [Pilaira anomala]|nr:hypothetical protein BD770DRAFT_407362 [Pilaira anomala]
MKIYSVTSTILCLISLLQIQAANFQERDNLVTAETDVLSSLNEARTAHEQSVSDWWNSVYEQYGQPSNALVARDVNLNDDDHHHHRHRHDRHRHDRHRHDHDDDHDHYRHRYRYDR